MIIMAIFLYILPTVVAACRGHKRTLGLFLINAFLGWTLIGWVAAMVWAFQS